MLRISCLAILFLLPVAALVGCYQEDYPALVDAKVTEEWMRPGGYVDAIEFLESGGNYFYIDPPPGAYDMDREAILPFLRNLKQEFGDETELYAVIPEQENYAWGIVMKLPERSGEARVETFLAEAEKTFPGMIVTEWGYHWLSFDFLDQAAAEAIRRGRSRAQNGAL